MILGNGFPLMKVPAQTKLVFIVIITNYCSEPNATNLADVVRK